jgi:hypothetical protein
VVLHGEAAALVELATLREHPADGVEGLLAFLLQQAVQVADDGAIEVSKTPVDVALPGVPVLGNGETGSPLQLDIGSVCGANELEVLAG